MKINPFQIAKTATNIDAVNQTKLETAIQTGLKPVPSALHNLFWNYCSKYIENINKELNLILSANGLTPNDAENQLYPVIAKFNTNYFDNGGMQIYQRAAAHTLVKDVYGFAVDRWAGMATGTAVSAGTLTQETTTDGYSFKFAGLTVSGTGIEFHRQRIASQTAGHLKNKIISMQFRCRHDIGSSVNFTIYVRKADALDDFTTTTNIGNGGAQAVATGTSWTTIKYENLSVGDCSNGLEIEVKIESGAITTKNFEISNCKLEIGASCTEFVLKSYNEELINCQTNDYYKSSLTWKGKAEDGNSGGGGYGNRGGCEVPIPRNFPKVPSVSYVSGTLTIYSLTPVTYNRGDANTTMDISVSLTTNSLSMGCRVDTARAGDFATYGGDCTIVFILLSEL